MTLAVISRGKDFFLASVLFLDLVRLYMNQTDIHKKRNQDKLAFRYVLVAGARNREESQTWSEGAQRGRVGNEALVVIQLFL